VAKLFDYMGHINRVIICFVRSCQDSSLKDIGQFYFVSYEVNGYNSFKQRFDGGAENEDLKMRDCKCRTWTMNNQFRMDGPSEFFREDMILTRICTAKAIAVET